MRVDIMNINDKIDILLSVVFCSFKRAQAADSYAQYLRMADAKQDRNEWDKADELLDRAKELLAVMTEMDNEFVRLAKHYTEHLKKEYPEVYKTAE